VKLKHIFLEAFLSLLLSFSVDAQVTGVDWHNDSTTLLRNGSGSLLSAGTNANSDGALIQLGFFTLATSGNLFAGTWVPLTGVGSNGKTTIGDTATASSSSSGTFQFNTYFVQGSSSPQVYDPSAYPTTSFQTGSSIQITSTSPASGQILSIRFFDSNSGGNYNTVSSASWLWITPDNSAPVVLIDLANSNLSWQDSASPFKTSISPVPEPSTFAFALIGLGALALRRRRLLAAAN
jgi:MYXO-CTERM domain-containing protein